MDCFAALAMTAEAVWRPARSQQSRPHQRVSVLGQKQNLRDADLHRRGRRDEFRTLTRLAFERVDGVEADVETRALRHQALDHLAIGILRAQQLDAGPE